MEAVKRAFRTAEMQIEEAEATVRIRRAYSNLMVPNASTLFGVLVENEKRSELSRALKDKDTDSSMLHRGLIIQINGIFENFVRSICEAVLNKKSKDAGSFYNLNEKTRNEYIYHAAELMRYARGGNIHGRHYNFDKLLRSLSCCILDSEDYDVKGEVFTLLIGNCTSDKLSKLFETLCLTDPFDEKIGTHKGLKRCSKERSNRRVANFAKKTLNEQIDLRNDIAHGNLTKSISLSEFEFSVCFFRNYMEAITENIVQDFRAI